MLFSKSAAPRTVATSVDALDDEGVAPQTAGAFKPLAVPVRIYDSRPGTQPAGGLKTKFANHEERVLDAHPGVAEAAVIAIADQLTGQAPYAYVVPVLDPPPTPAELQVYCAGQLARFKLPAGIELVSELPHSPIGKVRKGALR